MTPLLCTHMQRKLISRKRLIEYYTLCSMWLLIDDNMDTRVLIAVRIGVGDGISNKPKQRSLTRGFVDVSKQWR